MQVLSLQEDGTWIAEDRMLPEWSHADALLLQADAEPSSEMQSAHHIGIEFPAFNDGRALSLAVLLRTRYKFSGDLYALGEVHQDILHYMVRCGFNRIVCPSGCTPEVALSLITPYSQFYQGSVNQPEPSFKRVERGIKA